MTKLFVANVSRHRHVFTCQLPEQAKLWQQELRPMTQKQIAGDMSAEDINSILDHHRRYGLVSWTEARKSKGFVGLCYNLDAPVRIETFYETQETNDAALNALSTQIHEEAAVAIAEGVERDLGKPIKRLEIEMIEDTRVGSPQVSRGVEVVREGIQPNHKGANVVVKK